MDTLLTSVLFIHPLLQTIHLAEKILKCSRVLVNSLMRETYVFTIIIDSPFLVITLLL